MKTIHRSTIFLKKVPESFTHEEYKLGKYNTTLQVYKELFQKRDEFYHCNQADVKEKGFVLCFDITPICGLFVFFKFFYS